ncbi:hypothetical protein CCHR01_05491 [Colletotrichum chrysophilum]|uniref:Uncharacterized protein n=1 Tax=Colletotrichum chrysophilum TaxID=1836956 RepID=A0AAD9EPE0_9PEZI|nr:hypothetical protein CCHR01_05491 [Colletotrichum chrysophilum]
MARLACHALHCCRFSPSRARCCWPHPRRRSVLVIAGDSPSEVTVVYCQEASGWGLEPSMAWLRVAAVVIAVAMLRQRRHRSWARDAGGRGSWIERRQAKCERAHASNSRHGHRHRADRAGNARRDKASAAVCLFACLLPCPPTTNVIPWHSIFDETVARIARGHDD